MPSRTSTEEQKINLAIAAEFRVFKARRDLSNKRIAKMFSQQKLVVSEQRILSLLSGKRRMSAAELLILESEGLSVSSVKELLRNGAR